MSFTKTEFCFYRNLRHFLDLVSKTSDSRILQRNSQTETPAKKSLEVGKYLFFPIYCVSVLSPYTCKYTTPWTATSTLHFKDLYSIIPPSSVYSCAVHLFASNFTSLRDAKLTRLRFQLLQCSLVHSDATLKQLWNAAHIHPPDAVVNATADINSDGATAFSPPLAQREQ